MRVRFALLIVALFISGFINAQKTIESWYDENWEGTHVQLARYFSHMDNTDSGWYRKDMYVSTKQWQMIGLYEDKECKIRNGVFRWYFPNGKLKMLEKYIHNKKVGLHLEFYSDGSLKDSATYIDGHLMGTSQGWYKNGNQEYTLTLDETGKGVYTSWFDNGNPSSAGRYKNFNLKNGRWQYFHKNGKVSAVVLYDADNITNSQYFNEEGSIEDDTTQIFRTVQFPGGKKAWSKFMSDNLFFPSNLEIVNGYRAVLFVTATVTEDGKLTDIEVSLPLHPQFDKIAVEALKKSPQWIPAKEYNRKVASRLTQSVSYERSYTFE